MLSAGLILTGPDSQRYYDYEKLPFFSTAVSAGEQTLWGPRVDFLGFERVDRYNNHRLHFPLSGTSRPRNMDRPITPTTRPLNRETADNAAAWFLGRFTSYFKRGLAVSAGNHGAEQVLAD